MDTTRPNHASRRGNVLRYVALLAAALVLDGCASGPVRHESPGRTIGTSAGAGMSAVPTPSSVETVLAPYGLAGLDAAQIIERLDTTPIADRPRGLTASVRPTELMVSDDAGRTASLRLPADRFYLSVAPYLNHTHDCYFHSLTTCRGELSRVAMDITVRDETTGAVIVHKRSTTYDNGFVGLWLPRDLTATLTVEYQGRGATSVISTDDVDDATCLTTMRLR
jgi:hypothetical protein